MARVETITLTSDLDGSPADTTVTIGLDREIKDVDLSAAQEAELREFLAPYLTGGRRASNGNGKPAKPARSTDAARNAEVRAWAAERGFELGVRGRIPRKILQAYAAERG